MLRGMTAVATGAIVYWATPALHLASETVDGLWQGMPARGLIAGAVVALAFDHKGKPWPVAALAAIAAMLGVLVLGAVEPVAAVLGVACAAAAGAGGVLAVRRGARRALAFAALLLILGTYLWTLGVIPGPNSEPMTAFKNATIAPEPVDEQYASDGFIYLKAFHLMEAGVPYYDAMKTALVSDARIDRAPTSAFNYRPPLPFYLWMLFPGAGGIAVWNGLVILTLAAAISALFVGSRLAGEGAALLGPALLLSYFAHPLAAPGVESVAVWTWFSFPEYWAGGLLVIVAAAVLADRWKAAAVWFTLAVATNFLTLALGPALFAAWVARRGWTNERAALAIGVLGPVAVIGTHLMWAPASGASTMDLTAWTNGGWSRLTDALAFSGDYFPGGSAPLLWVPLLGFAGGLWARGLHRKVFVIGATLSATLFLLIVSSGEWGYYWGVVWQPLMIALVPGVFGLLLPPKGPACGLTASTRSRPSTVKFVLPAYNEAASIKDLIERIGAVMSESDQKYSILVVDDGSRDGTAKAAGTMRPAYPVTVVSNKKNMGLGCTISRGLKAASAHARADEVIVTMDADLTQDPMYVPAMLARYRAGADVVIASRFQPGSRVVGLSGFRRFMTLGARTIMELFLHADGVRDYSCGYRLYAAPVLREAYRTHGDDLVCQRGFACMVEILGRLRKSACFAEVPFVLHYEEKRTASAMNVKRTVFAYFKVIKDVYAEELFHAGSNASARGGSR
jgi:dolichol-phosphate mannosyltransferase